MAFNSVSFDVLESPKSARATLSSSPEDDFVLVPSPTEQLVESLGDRQ